MSARIKVLIPEPFRRRLLSPILRRPAVHYLRRWTWIRYLRLFKRKPVAASPKPSFLPRVGDIEPLFGRSEEVFRSIVSPHTSEFKWFLGRIYNSNFETLDVEIYYSMIRTYRPKVVVEVGSGHSAFFAQEALRKNRGGRMICIDPRPQRPLPSSVANVRAKVEDVDRSLFERLEQNDILFIDSSHSTEEATFHIEEILPRLQEGVIVHHHDVPFPHALYFRDDPATFGEPHVVLDFYLEHQDTFEILTSTSYVRFKHPDLVRELIPSYRALPPAITGTAKLGFALSTPSSLWTRKHPSPSHQRPHG